MPLNANLKEQLKKISAGVKFANPRSPIVSALETQGYLTVNRGAADPSDPAKYAVSVTFKGLEELGLQPLAEPVVEAPTPAPAAAPAPLPPETPAPPAAPTPPAAKAPPVVLATGNRIKMPAITRASRKVKKVETYPFSTLGEPVLVEGEWLYDSFFIASTETNPNPTKSFAGTVSSANKRFALDGKKFSIVHVKHDTEHGKDGARVLRVDQTLAKSA